MLYLIGLGLDKDDLSLKALNVIKKCKKIYLESYTTNFPYCKDELEKIIKRKIEKLERKDVEENFLDKYVKGKGDVALLIYGDPLIATTHISLILEAKKAGIGVKIFHGVSVYNAITETGLQIYKFGKTTSIPKWKENYKPSSFVDIIKENLSINAHTLLLVDIDLNFKDALNELKETTKNKLNLGKIIVCSKIGTKDSKIYYGKMEELEKLNEKKIKKPFCFIIPSKLHFIEEEYLKNFEI